MDNRRHTARCDRRIRRSTQIHLEIFGSPNTVSSVIATVIVLLVVSRAQMLTFR